MSNKVKLIAISGNARVGKGTCENILKKIIGSKLCYSASFAKALREDCREYCIQQFGIDSFETETKQKNVIRPILIESARIKRDRSMGDYYAVKLKKRLLGDGFLIEQDENSNHYFAHDTYKYIIISDFRFCEYYNSETDTGDELGFINQFGGFKIHINQSRNGKLVQPFSHEEKKNEKMLKGHANIEITWPFINNDDEDKLYNKLSEYVVPAYRKIRDM